MNDSHRGARAVVEGLRDAMNAHDLEKLVACFHDDVESVQPSHPSRSFKGRAQLRVNWTQILGAIPDLRADLLACVAGEHDAWAEWRWVGTRADGGRFEMCGVTVQTLRDGVIGSVRFFMEPVDASAQPVGAAVRDVIGR